MLRAEIEDRTWKEGKEGRNQRKGPKEGTKGRKEGGTQGNMQAILETRKERTWYCVSVADKGRNSPWHFHAPATFSLEAGKSLLASSFWQCFCKKSTPKLAKLAQGDTKKVYLTVIFC